MYTAIDHESTQDALMSANPEANVWIILTSDTNQIKTIPVWECTMSPDEIQSLAITEAAIFNEFLGSGTVTAQIFNLSENQAAMRLTAEDLDIMLAAPPAAALTA